MFCLESLVCLFEILQNKAYDYNIINDLLSVTLLEWFSVCESSKSEGSVYHEDLPFMILVLQVFILASQ